MTFREKFIVLVDNDCINKSDAIILLEGDGLNRYQKAVDLFNNGWADKIVFSGGITNYEYGSFPFSDILPHILKGGVPKNSIIHENKSKNTREQAEEILNLATKNNWRKLILVATHNHQYRAYLTFLRKVFDINPKIVVFNAPVRNLFWYKETNWGTRFEQLEQEFERIEKYSTLGHLATYEQAIEYQKWKEQQI
jgi:uncharacterized SAM-binding protein YcdF (DUF218 family)